MKDGTRREKNWSQKNHEVKVFDDNDWDVELRDKVFDLQKQLYNEMIFDGLPEGGDARAVLESHKLAEEIERW
jgi:hypothetical protein